MNPECPKDDATIIEELRTRNGNLQGEINWLNQNLEKFKDLKRGEVLLELADQRATLRQEEENLDAVVARQVGKRSKHLSANNKALKQALEAIRAELSTALLDLASTKKMLFDEKFITCEAAKATCSRIEKAEHKNASLKAANNSLKRKLVKVDTEPAWVLGFNQPPSATDPIYQLRLQ